MPSPESPLPSGSSLQKLVRCFRNKLFSLWRVSRSKTVPAGPKCTVGASERGRTLTPHCISLQEQHLPLGLLPPAPPAARCTPQPRRRQPPESLCHHHGQWFSGCAPCRWHGPVSSYCRGCWSRACLALTQHLTASQPSVGRAADGEHCAITQQTPLIPSQNRSCFFFRKTFLLPSQSLCLCD